MTAVKHHSEILCLLKSDYIRALFLLNCTNAIKQDIDTQHSGEHNYKKAIANNCESGSDTKSLSYVTTIIQFKKKYINGPTIVSFI